LFWGGAIVFDETMKARVLTPEARSGYNGTSTYDVVREYQESFARARPDADAAARMSYLELKLRLPELLLMRVDKITMATSVEGPRAVSRSSLDRIRHEPAARIENQGTDRQAHSEARARIDLAARCSLQTEARVRRAGARMVSGRWKALSWSS
jgi:hypothetical protein